MQLFYALPLYCIFISSMLALIIWNILYICLKVRFSKTLNLFAYLNKILSIISIFVIIYITILSRKSCIQEIEMIPFHSFIKAKIQPELYRSMFMNIVLFFPIGIFMPFSFKIRSYKNIFYTLIFALAFSISIETLQYIFSLGYCEIDDVIMNSIGVALGTLSFLISKFIEKKVNACA